MLWAGLIVLAIPAASLLWRLLRRPQLGVLALAAAAPFDGLLLLVDEPTFVTGWKEGLVVLTLLATVVAPGASRAARPGMIPSWLGPVVALLAISVVSALQVELAVAAAGFKVDYFYLLIPLAIWRCPLNAEERDRLITILMIGAVVTSLLGIAQQLLGEDALNRLGYEFNTVIRTTGDSVLRSFSTFELPFPFAFYVAFVLAVAAPVALADLARFRSRLFLLFTPVLMLGILSAVVRAAVLAIVVAVVYHLVRNYRAVLSATPLLLLIVVVAPATLLSAVLSSRSLGERVDGWSLVADTVIAQPLGTGIGTTGSAAEVALDYGGEIDETFGLTPDLLPYQPDNYYVKRLLELGPIGLWLTIALLRHVIESGRQTRKRASPADVAMIDGFIASVLGAAAAAVVATYWEIFPLDLYFWMMLGVLTSIDRAESPSPAWPSGQTELAFRPTSASS
ncbi:MAG: O-antigen ligase family protein [Acidimicrobiales bacterium]